MRRVVIESPYAGRSALPEGDPGRALEIHNDRRTNVAYAEAALLDCLTRDEAPMAGHLLYTRVLDDSIPEERARGLAAHLRWIADADALVVYTDRGISPGMQLAIDRAGAFAFPRPIEYRTLAGWGAS